MSQVLLSRFLGTDERARTGIAQSDIAKNTVLDPKPPRSVAFDFDFVRHEAKRMEDLWNTVENPMRTVYEILADGRPEDLDSHRILVEDST
ncbi:hypothetical protein [Sinomonas albida]|uniref:hypothetical protein n=1 Tax=Sinomonas albida TaxID=369942 RepID=UPI0010A8223A|nr:hypothetical protein [Sinomonas albida]